MLIYNKIYFEYALHPLQCSFSKFIMVTFRMLQLQKNPLHIVSSSIRVSSFGDEICCWPPM